MYISVSFIFIEFISSNSFGWSFYGFLHIILCHLPIETILLIFFWFEWLLFLACYFLIVLTVLFWIKVMRMDNVVLFLMLEKKLSAFHHWIWYYLWACHWWPLQCWGFPGGSDGKESTCKAGGLDFIPRLGRSPGGGNGKPLQYYCLENPVDRGVWWAIVCGVVKSQTRLSN